MNENQIWLVLQITLTAACLIWFYKYFLPLDKKPKLRQLKDVKNGEFILVTGTDYNTYDGCEVINNDVKNKKMYCNIHHRVGNWQANTFTTLEYGCFFLQDFQTLNTFQNIKFCLGQSISEKERLQNLLKQYEKEEQYEKAAEVKRMIDLLK